ncbi:NAD-dependent epimerase/dehydratase family protein [Leptospira ilyithenensis]|uniref:NAD-dependent epimerase/dehydratase family protein n=1 Tax=Leptospira ilyithenensis TaxID=2484901 RepID=A0A4R9LPM0_9LEPT|nr:NAD-dependent epimerase/dehydratase family protein [Leptospira ilyithenensis]TGN10027.1 NAD-dependent epimerase/dehydratase family protein [Leptospira ilyithenensis]
MKKALVLGGTGGSGKAIAEELLGRKIPTVILGRDLTSLEKLAKEWGNPKELEFVVGDVFSPESLIPYFEDADVVFQAANVSYQEMESKLLLLGKSVMKAAEETGKKIVFVDGVYVYGKNPGYPVEEDYPYLAHTKKGKIKVEFAKMILSDLWKKAKPLIVRLPDYYGPTSKLAYLNPTLDGLATRKFGIFFGSLQPKREYVYLPDAAKMIVAIALQENSFGSNWNIPGGMISGNEIVRIAETHLGRKSKVISLGRFTVKLSGIFDSFLREVVEIMYLMEDPLQLSGRKYLEKIGPIPRTSFEDGIAETLDYIRKRSSAK